MAYTPIGWQTGDTITAEKMNKMDNGWGVQATQLVNETVTTYNSEFGSEGELSYDRQITSNTITVVFESNTYTCQKIEFSSIIFYGGFDPEIPGPDFTEYPFVILSYEDGYNVLQTETAGEYSITVNGEGVAVSDNFSTAVGQCVDTSTLPMLCVSGTTKRMEMEAAVTSGRLLYFYYTQDYNSKMCIIANMYTTPMTLIPSDARVTANFDSDEDETFIVTVL